MKPSKLTPGEYRLKLLAMLDAADALAQEATAGAEAGDIDATRICDAGGYILWAIEKLSDTSEPEAPAEYAVCLNPHVPVCVGKQGRKLVYECEVCDLVTVVGRYQDPLNGEWVKPDETSQ